jgi:Ca2+-binding RTX toxin-like protein
LVGENGDDILIGRGGNDRLLGGAGADQFRFSSSSEGIDTIADFETVNDSIQIRGANFGGGLTRGAISADQFRFAAFALDERDRFIYSSFDNGALFFDADGTGEIAPIQIATLIGTPALRAADIIIF